MRRLVWILRRLLGSLHRTELACTVAVWRAIDTSSLRIEPSRWKRTLNAISSVIRDAPNSGQIWAVSMVKNEADIIRETIRNLRAQGVDHILVADNGSSDDTVTILREEGVMVVSDPIAAYWQAQKMTHLSRAAARHGAAWIVPFDADELWKGTAGSSLAETLRSSVASVVEAEWWNFVPLAEGDSSSVAVRFPWRLLQPEPRGKQAFRANWLARVAMGNHSVFVPGAQVARVLRIAHYRSRSAEQMVQKARDGAAASTLAGHPSGKLPQWFELTDIAAAHAKLAAMTATELVRDPSVNW